MAPTIVGANIDTWIFNIHGTLSSDLDEQLPLPREVPSTAVS
jgi:hypothetical protein